MKLIEFQKETEILAETERLIKEHGYKKFTTAKTKESRFNRLIDGFADVIRPVEIGTPETGKGIAITRADITLPCSVPNQEAALADCWLLTNTTDAALLADSITRIVIGDYGAFFEVAADHIIRDELMIPASQQYRTRPPYIDTVKYLWYTDKTTKSTKVYHQLRPVAYADYRPDYYYVSVYEALAIPDEALKDRLLARS